MNDQDRFERARSISSDACLAQRFKAVYEARWANDTDALIGELEALSREAAMRADTERRAREKATKP